MECDTRKLTSGRLCQDCGGVITSNLPIITGGAGWATAITMHPWLVPEGVLP